MLIVITSRCGFAHSRLRLCVEIWFSFSKYEIQHHGHAQREQEGVGLELPVCMRRSARPEMSVPPRIKPMPAQSTSQRSIQSITAAMKSCARMKVAS